MEKHILGRQDVTSSSIELQSWKMFIVQSNGRQHVVWEIIDKEYPKVDKANIDIRYLPF